MITILFIVLGVFVVCGAIYLAMSSGTRGGRHNQSSRSAARLQRQEGERASTPRATPGND